MPLYANNSAKVFCIWISNRFAPLCGVRPAPLLNAFQARGVWAPCRRLFSVHSFRTSWFSGGNYDDSGENANKNVSTMRLTKTVVGREAPKRKDDFPTAGRGRPVAFSLYLSRWALERRLLLERSFKNATLFVHPFCQSKMTKWTYT